MEGSSASNREKVYSMCGDVTFMKVYNCTEAPPGGSLCVPLSMYKATKAIKKSPDSKSNRNKICKKGRTLYVVGAVAGPGTTLCEAGLLPHTLASLCSFPCTVPPCL